MRLIDADELIDTIYGKDYFTQTIKDVLENIIETQPTAYNPEKVGEELETAKSVKNFGSRNSGNLLIPLNDAIDIVKRGGVE